MSRIVIDNVEAGYGSVGVVHGVSVAPDDIVNDPEVEWVCPGE